MSAGTDLFARVRSRMVCLVVGLVALATAVVGLDVRAEVSLAAVGLGLLTVSLVSPSASAATLYGALLVVVPGVRYLLGSGPPRMWLLVASALILCLYLLVWSGVPISSTGLVPVAGLAGSVLVVAIATGVSLRGPAAAIVGLAACAAAYRVCVPSSRADA